MQLIGMLDLNINTPSGASKVISEGDLELIQSKPILIDSKSRTVYNKDPLTDANNHQHSLEEIRENYHLRSERLDFKSNDFVMPLGNRFSTTLDITVNIPVSQQIKYRPGVMETIKFGWVQYIFIMIPSVLIAFSFIGYMFESKLLDAIMVSDLKHKRKII